MQRNIGGILLAGECQTRRLKNKNGKIQTDERKKSVQTSDRAKTTSQLQADRCSKTGKKSLSHFLEKIVFQPKNPSTISDMKSVYIYEFHPVLDHNFSKFDI
ncbi:hypothetical protein CEXT_426321 [Caerostris extrusa]|uniref:Uncharacterized protein n=1 Tax=Caerostris extrusa TaxID=172846 RepID=A0AAV4SRR8_CAEEX|nr:hypothetical protein CEXT_426321 [Caerostris extrusa]